MNLTIDINNKTEIRNAITLLESLLPKPAAKVAAKAEKKVDPPKIPSDISEPPTGYIYAGLGPLKVEGRSRPNGYADIAMFTIYNKWDISGWAGDCDNKHYAVKKGSKIAKLNGL